MNDRVVVAKDLFITYYLLFLSIYYYNYINLLLSVPSDAVH